MSRYGPRSGGKSRLSKKLALLFTALLLIGLLEMAIILQQLNKKETDNDSNYPSGSTRSSEPAFDKTQHSINQASSLWAVVNKGRKLPTAYSPEGLTAPNVSLRFSKSNSEMMLRADAARAMEEMFAASARENIFLRLSSGYRSYYSQSSIYAREVRTYGQTQADRESARSGHSEHQTGLAADLAPKNGKCEIADCFADTAEGNWLAANAYKYGFILRYPDGKENKTGYRYEPWHFRYVGKELAAEINRTGQTLEELFGQTSHASYPSNIYKLQ